MTTARGLVVLLTGLACVGLAGCGGGEEEQGGPPGGGGGGGGGGMPPANVRTAEIEMQEVQQRLRLTGSLRATRRAEVAAVEPGRVMEVAFDEGDRVEKDAVLVRLDTRRLAEEMAEAEADQAAAEATLRQRQSELRRAREDLANRQSAAEQMSGAVSENELREFRTGVEVAESAEAAARTQLAAVAARIGRIRVQMEDAVVKAPFAGKVLMRSAELGEYLSPGQSVATLATDDSFEAVLDAPESLDPSTAAADPGDVLLRLAAGNVTLTPTAVRPVGDVDPRSRRYALIADVKVDPSLRLSAGQSVTADVPVGAVASRLVVPADAIRLNQNGSFVYLEMFTNGEEAPPVAIQMPVEVEFIRGNEAILATPAGGPLQPGVGVVVEGAERIFMPGMQPLKEDPPEANPATRPAA